MKSNTTPKLFTPKLNDSVLRLRDGKKGRVSYVYEEDQRGKTFSVKWEDGTEESHGIADVASGKMAVVQ